MLCNRNYAKCAYHVQYRVLWTCMGTKIPRYEIAFPSKLDENHLDIQIYNIYIGIYRIV